MEIKKGLCYKNRTWKYLFPCLKYHGETFKNKLRTVWVLAVGIEDSLYKKKELSERSFFILIDKSHRKDLYESFMQWLKYQPFYVSDYPYDDIYRGTKQIIIVKCPSECYEAYDKFKKGEYSEMYTMGQLLDLYGNYQAERNEGEASWIEAKERMLKIGDSYTLFIKDLKKEFGENLSISRKDLENQELDFPVEYNKKTEVFNYGVC